MKRKVLVTGGAGFIGSHLVKRLILKGSDVSVVVRYKSINDNIRLSSVWDQITPIEADLRNIDSLRQFKDQSYDVVFHLAAYNHVGDSFLHVNEALVSNAVATANLLEFLPEFERFVYISSSEVYGCQKEVPFQEDFLPAPISPYAIGKYAGELYSRMKRLQSGQEIVCVRAFNAFGPYQSEKAVIPEMIIKCLKGVSVETTEGKQTREFNYVENLVEGLIAAAEVKPAHEGLINLCSGEEIAICDLVQKIHQLSNSSSKLKIGALPNRPTEIWRMSGSSHRAQELLNWKPKISFEEGLIKTIEWFKRYYELFYKRDSQLNQL